MEKPKVHQEWGYRLVKSSQVEDRYYRVFYGTVEWNKLDNGKLHRACVVFVQYGNTEDWTLANKKKEISFDHPAHILNEDIDKVMAAIKELRTEFEK